MNVNMIRNKSRKLADVYFENVIIPPKTKDFSGNKFGPNKRQFSIIVTDPDVQKNLIDLGVNVYFSPYANKDEPPKGYVTCKLDFGYTTKEHRDVEVGVITDDGTGTLLDENNVGTLDSAWIKSADLKCNIVQNVSPTGKISVSVYCKTLYCHLMSDKDKEEYYKERPVSYGDELRKKYDSYFR